MVDQPDQDGCLGRRSILGIWIRRTGLVLGDFDRALELAVRSVDRHGIIVGPAFVGLFIVAKANHDDTVDKLMRVGANRAVSPYQISAFRMATFALHPGVADFVDNVLDLKNSEIQITDMTVGSASPLVGYPIEKYLANRKSGVSVLVINRSDGHALINPLGDTIIQSGDRLIMMGIRANLEAVEKIIH